MLKKLQAAILKRSLRRMHVKVSQGAAGLRRDARLLVEEHVSISARITEFSTLEVGAFTYVRSGSELLNVAVIGRFCSIGNDVILGQNARDHPMDWVSTREFDNGAPQHLGDASPTVIGNDVWIGREAMIMNGVTIGTGAIVGARSIVTRDVPPYAIAVGSPARIAKFRHSPEMIARLLASHWWEVDPAALRLLPFDDPAAFVSKIAAIKTPSAYRRMLLTRDTWRAREMLPVLNRSV